MATIIAFGSQPYQVEAGMGGTILKLTESANQVTIVDLTNGGFSKNQSSENRKREAIKASRILGIDERITLEYSYSEIEDGREIREEILEIYRNTSPDILFIPYPAEMKPESKMVAEICHASLSHLSPEGLLTRRKIFYYYASPFNYYQKPSFITDISREIEMKVEALRCYESHFGKNLQNSQLFDNILNLNRYYGMLIDKKFGESFLCMEPLEMKNIELMF